MCDAEALRVDGAATPDLAVGDLAAPRVVVPVTSGRHDIHVVQQEDGATLLRACRTPSFEPRIQARATTWTHQPQCGHSRLVDGARQVQRARSLTAWRVGRIDLQVALQSLRCRSERSRRAAPGRQCADGAQEQGKGFDQAPHGWSLVSCIANSSHKHRTILSAAVVVFLAIWPDMSPSSALATNKLVSIFIQRTYDTGH